jgi:hypothetical protein
MIDHGVLTDHVLAALQASFDELTTPPPLVGDGEAPIDGGWVEGQPGSGAFRPYTVLVSAGAAPRGPDLGSPEPPWAVGFSLRSFAGSRKQCDWIATKARLAVRGLLRDEFDAPWKVSGVEWQSLGPVVRVDATSPKTWQVFDSTVLVCSP